MFQINNFLSKKNKSLFKFTGSNLLPVSPAVNGLNKPASLNKSWLPGFGDNHKMKFTSAVKKLTSLMMLSLTIILISSFTLESGNKQNSNEALMTISDAPDWEVNFGYSFGSASSTAGDVNGDGYDDVIIGKKENTTNFTNDGKAYVFLGSSSGLAASPVWSDIGANEGSAYAHSLANAGDVNGDGYDDIIIGEPGYKVGSNSKGRALVYCGSSTGPSAAPSWTYTGTTTDFGRSVSTAGDANGDGYDDVIVSSAYGGLDSASNKGAVLIFYGSDSGLSAMPDWQKEGTQSFGQFGHRVRNAGDVNNDGYSDIIVGAPVNSGAAGQVFVYLGSASGLSITPVWTGTGEFSNQRFGYSVHNAGDVNSDGYDDIVVGAPDDNAGGTGKAYVHFGNSSGVSASANWTAIGDANSNFGQWAATAGDYNGDGFSDLIVGAPNNSPYGKAFVYKGSSAGLSANSVWISEGDASSAAYGIVVGTAGDVNNDGFDDVLLTPYSPKAFVFHGAADSGNVVVSGAMSPNGTYQNLADAFAVINSMPQTGANITISITGNTTEPPTGAVLNNGAWNSILIKPDGGEARNVTGNINNGLPLIDLNGADNVTIDGLNTGGNTLTISNPRSVPSFENFPGTSTIRLRSDATYNVITRCTILGSAKGALSTEIGNIIFSSNSSLTGNDFNVVSYCDIGPAGSTLPSRAIHFGGTTSSTNLNNSGDTIRNCNIYDFQDSLYAHAGISIRQGSTDIVIKDNRFYQTQSRTLTTNFTIIHHAIKIDNTTGNNFTISGNIIGHSAANGTGTYTVTFENFSKFFIPIELNAGTTAASNIQGNVIKSILISNSLSGDFFKGINVLGGSVNVGTESGNIIGDSALTESILVNGFASGTCTMKGIYLSGNGTCITRNNRLSGIKLNMTNGAPSRLYGIQSELSTYWECRNNTIGGPVELSIVNTGTNQSTELNGIVNSGGAADISENLIRNLNTIGGTVFGSFAAPLAGIRSDGSGDQTISKNVIHTLTNTNPSLTGNGGAANVMGIFFSNNSGNNVIEKNLIHSLKINSYIGSIHGMRIMSGTSEYRNNMIRLGVDASGNGADNPCWIYGISDQGGVNSFYHNSIYIGGNPFAGGSGSTYGVYSTQTGPRNYINNSIYNARSNNGSGGIHACIRIFNLPGFTSDYNILYANGSGGIVAYFNAQTPTLASWRNATGQDFNSVSADPYM
ncbi:MAG: VCBS repeat-containing protein [Ignavibacteria bacterium]|nr:VCBS repeat-containing protein [Ignavibacteria bacterium]